MRICNNANMYKNEYYNSLKKPVITPPAFVFKIVWTVLYLMIFSALYFIVKAPENPLKKFAITIFVFQLLLNILWSPVLFIYKKMKLSLIICFLIVIFVGITIFLFSKISVIAVYLMIPYLLWCVFACFLIMEFIRINE